ncbi:hypothetical protein Tco_1116043 [Tanacetum coccineum]
MDKQSVSNDLLRNVASRMNKMMGKGNACVSQTRLQVRGSQNPKSDSVDHEFSESRSLIHNNPSQSSTSPLKSTQDGSYTGTNGSNDSSTPKGDQDRVSNLAGRSSTARVANYSIVFPDSAHDYDLNVQTRNTEDIDDFVQDLQLGKHELWPSLSKEKGNEITDIVCNRYVVLSESASMPTGAPIVDDLSTKASPNVDDNLSTGASTMAQPQVNSNFRPLVADPVFNGVNISIPRKVVEKVSAWLEHTLYGYFIGKRLMFPVVEYYARNNWGKHGLKRVKLHDVPLQFFEEDGISLIATFIGKPIMLDLYTSSMCKDSWGRGSFARCLIEVNSKADLVDSVTIGIPSLMGDDFTKEPIRVVSPPIVTTSNVATPTVEKSNDGFRTVGKKKKRKGKSKPTNGGQFVGPSVKQTIRYEPKATPNTPKKGTDNVSNPSTSSSMLKAAETFPKKDNFTTSNSFSALNDEDEDDEEVENG